MQHHDAWMNPKTHQLQQTIYLATANLESTDPDNLSRSSSNTRARPGRRQGIRGASASSSRSKTTAPIYEALVDHDHEPPCSPTSSTASRSGVLFGLLALGFMLIVGVMEVINLAHGSLFALGAYVAMELDQPALARRGRRRLPRVAAPAALRAGARRRAGRRRRGGDGARALVRRTYGKKAEYGLLLTFGAALVLEEAHPHRVGHG